MPFDYFDSIISANAQDHISLGNVTEANADMFDEQAFLDDNQFDTPTEEIHAALDDDNVEGPGNPNDNMISDIFQDDEDFHDAAPFDFDEEDAEADEPDFSEEHDSEMIDDPVQDQEQESGENDEDNTSDPSETDMHEETEVSRENDVSEEIDQTDDINQEEETIIDEPAFYPDENDYDLDLTDEEYEIQAPEEWRDDTELESDYETTLLADIMEAVNFADAEADGSVTDFVQNYAEFQQAVEAELQAIDQDIEQDPFSVMQMLEIDDYYDDVFASLLPSEDLGDPLFQLFDGDFMDVGNLGDLHFGDIV